MTGPASSCAGDTSVYTVEVPVACSCQWLVNGTLQPDTTPEFSILWTQPGNYTISVMFICEGGQTSEPDSIETYVGTMPPSPILGPGSPCLGSQAVYSTIVGPGDVCRWTVDGILQPVTAPTLIVTWNSTGPHLVEVRADGPCGTSDPVSRNITVFAYPDVSLGNDTTLQQNQTLLLDAGNPGCSYLWSTGATSQTILVSVSGTYSVNVTNACGSDSDEIEVVILVGVPEPSDISGIVLSSLNKILIIKNMPENIEQLEVYGMTGQCVYKGKPAVEITLPSSGIYILRFVYSGKTCECKVAVL